MRRSGALSRFPLPWNRKLIGPKRQGVYFWSIWIADASASVTATFTLELVHSRMAAMTRVLERFRGLGPRIAAMGLAGGVAGFLFITVVGRTYETRGAFVTQGSSGSGLQGIASQLGLSGASEWGQSPEFYQELLRSNAVLGRVIAAPLAEPGDTGRAQTLVELLNISGGDSAIKRARAINKLKSRMAVSASRRTGIISFTVRLSSPWLAQKVGLQLLEEVSRFDLAARRSRAKLEREFIEKRESAARQELSLAEDQLKRFVERNRQPQSSPTLLVEYERLRRDVQRREAVHTTVSTAFEKARIDEVRDTPVVTIMQQPELPALPQGRRLYYIAGGAILFGALGVAGLARREVTAMFSDMFR